MRRFVLIFLSSAAWVTSAGAQTLERIDPLTGNYTPVRDPYFKDEPDPDSPNPNRLDNRLSVRNAPRAAPQASVRGSSKDGLSPAQHAAQGSAYNGQALSMIPGVAAADTGAEQSPFAKPDWWPQ